MNWQPKISFYGTPAFFLGENEDDSLIEVYECVDHTWRVWFKHGLSTPVMDVKIRNLPNEAVAKERAAKWLEEYEKAA